MNAPFPLAGETIRLADLRQPDEVARIEGFVAELGGSVFQRPAWLAAVAEGTRQHALGLIAEKRGAVSGWLPLNEIHSPLFGRVLVSSGFAVGGGALAYREGTALALAKATEELAIRRSCSTVELRGGVAPDEWTVRTDSHSGFAKDLEADDEAQLLAVPRKQRAEVRKSLDQDFTVHIGVSGQDRSDHYRVYAESVRNLGTPVFPKSLFDAAIERLDADILTIRHRGAAVASVLSLYHDGAVLPYWGGGTHAARALRANERMYFELMLHARRRGCTRFDFGRSKTGSGAWSYKKNWGFDPEPLAYASWTVPGAVRRDADPTSARHAQRIALWRRLPLGIANRIGPHIARGLG